MTTNDTSMRRETPPFLIRPDATAEALAISPRTLWALTASGEIPHVRIGRSVRYDPEDLRKWLKDQKRGRGGARRGS